MKHILIILGFVFTTTFNFAQSNSINYKAIIKDGSGNVVANQSVTVQFTILSNAVNVYQETHAPTTDANGIVILNIGTGTTTDIFTDIDWNTFDHTLNVQVNIGAGLVDMGTTSFSMVPYAHAAGNVSGLETLDEGNGMGWRLRGSDPSNYGDIGAFAVDLSFSDSASAASGATGTGAFASGIRSEASGTASVALGYFSIASGSVSFAAGGHAEATGDDSVAIGPFAKASGDNSIALGRSFASGNNSFSFGFQSNISGYHAIGLGSRANASGSNSVAIGENTFASADNAVSIGNDSSALGIDSFASGFRSFAVGDHSFSRGYNTRAESYYTTVFGIYNIGGGSPTDWINTDPLFEIGNGDDNTNKSNALTILKNGTITAPSFDIAEITNDKALITKEYADTNLGGSGLEAIDEGNGIGWRLKGKDEANYGDVGEYATDLSNSTSVSSLKGALGDNSTAFGYNTFSSGFATTSMGNQANASGSAATAMGFATEAIGFNSTAMGFLTKAEAYIATTIGRYNLGGGNATTWIATEPLFEIGNGTDGSNRANALTVLKNGKVGIGEHQPSGFLEVKAVNSGTQPNINLIHEGATGARINFTNTDTTNGNVWTLYGDSNDTDANSSFNLYHPNAGNIVQVKGDGQVGINGNPDTEFHVHHGANAGADGFTLENTAANTNSWRMYVVNSTGNLNLFSKIQGATSVGNFNDNTGVYSSTSDRRLKKDFQSLPFSWRNFMNLETLSYLYKSQIDNKRSLGMIAQDVELIYPELVTYNQEDDVYHLNYSGFGVVAIKAVQELKTEVDRLKEENNVLRAELLKFTSLEARLSALEANNDKSMQDSTRSEIKKE